jgi:LacI family transcriptional regulator
MTNTKRPTLRSIAAEAGVSVTTVSRVLSGKGQEFRIGTDTERRVLTVARRQNFSPNLMARGLRLKATRTIGLVVPGIANPFFARIACSVTDGARRRGYSVLLCDSQDNTDTEIEEVRILKDRHVEGLIICPVGISDHHLKGLESEHFPTVVVDRYFPALSLPAVGCDNVAAAQRGVDYLIECGHRCIACLQGLNGTLPNDQRLEGYRKALQDHGIEFDPLLVLGSGFTQESGYTATRRLIDSHSGVTAIFAASNQSALGALRAVSEAALRVPDDISLVSFDDIDGTEFMSTPVTAIAQPVGEMGRFAAEILFHQITSRSGWKESPTLLAAELIVRKSVRTIGRVENLRLETGVKHTK